ncbi:MAG: putative N-acetyl-LL-diaminopimelate aminotransferase [candidate division BRC1 bacterium ADurb.BinA292]|nr:MAG: putative N-acetyl-LL-diaminopimelate aminotransferase [candidate division BRC1 bacterium ADurb.BinA292]
MAEVRKVATRREVRPRVAEKVRTLPPSGIRAFFELVIGRDDVISLGVGEPDFVTPWHIRETALYRISQGDTTYTSNSGLLSTRAAIARYLHERFKATFDPEDEMLLTVGVSEGLDLVLRAILEPGDEVIIWQPSYVAYAPLVTLAGGVPVALNTSIEAGFGLDLNALENLITDRTRAVFINYPSNPTGATLRREDLEGLVRICVPRQILMISDEVYAELTHDGDHVSLAAIPGAAEWTVLLSGFSKAFAMTGWRLGYAAGPREVIAAMTKIHQYSIMCAPIMAQRAGEAALTEGLDDMREMCAIYRQRRNMIVKGLNEIGLPCHRPAGAFYAFPSIRHTGLDSETFCRKLLEEESVAIVPGNAFGEAGEGYVRMAYAASFQTIERALAGLERFLKRL